MSIDGHIENYEKFRKPAKWSKLLKFLIQLKNISRHKCRLAINYTVNPENVDDISRVHTMLEKYQLDELRLNIVQNWSEDQKAGELISGFSLDQLEYLRQNYQSLIKGKSDWDYPDCFWVKEGIYITAKGEMKVCCMNTSTAPIGNVIQTISVNELRRSKRFTEIVNGCLTNTPTEHCQKCSYKELTPLLKQLI